MENRKVKNATPAEYKGRTYRSKLEAKFAWMLDGNRIPFKYEEETWEVLPRQTYRGKAIRAVTYTPDFVLLDGKVVVEVKGWRNDVYPLKKKLIIKYINENRPGTVFIEARTMAGMAEVITQIKKQSIL